MLLAVVRPIQFLHIFVWVAAPDVAITPLGGDDKVGGEQGEGKVKDADDDEQSEGKVKDADDDAGCADGIFEVAATVLPSFSTSRTEVLPILSRNLAQSSAFNTTFGDGKLKLSFCCAGFLLFFSTLVLILEILVLTTYGAEYHQRTLSHVLLKDEKKKNKQTNILIHLCI